MSESQHDAPSWSQKEQLYHALPAIYRLRDAARGEPLRALLSVIERELEAVRHDINGLYDDWFIETCAEWVVPYIGDLLGVRPLHAIDNTDVYSLRAYVANTLAYRRRKGTASMLEDLARAVTGWPARAVEFFQLLATTQHVNHVRLGNLRTPDLRDTDALELLGTPFERAAYSGEVRSIASRRGKYNIPNVGLFLWRLQPYPVQRGTARAVGDPPDGRFTFNPLGISAPLFNVPQSETAITHLANEINVPGVLRRRALYEDLEAYRGSFISGKDGAESRYFGKPPVFDVVLDGEPLPPEQIVICDLDAWDEASWTPPASQDLTRADGIPFKTRVAVDPQIGRLVLIDDPPTSAELGVSYAYGFSADVGGGPYKRPDPAPLAASPNGIWRATVDQQETPVAGEVFNTLSAAVAEWHTQSAGTVGVITILDSHTYQEDLQSDTTVKVPVSSQLLVRAANGERPHIRGNISVRGTAVDQDAPGELILDGLLIEGTLKVLAGSLGNLHLNHCTLVPGKGGLQVNPSISPGSQNSHLRVGIVRSIVGSISLANTVPELSIRDTIVDGQSDAAIAASGSAVDIQASTIFGASTARNLSASDSIFAGIILAERRQVGCVRYSYVPDGSRTPRRYRCQPDLAVAGTDDPVAAANVRVRLVPQFTSTSYGHPGYAQLSLACADEIHTGAEDESEMGSFCHLKGPQREANLRATLEEYLRFGLEAGIFYVT